jgi:hypothetical protein
MCRQRLLHWASAFGAAHRGKPPAYREPMLLNLCASGALIKKIIIGARGASLLLGAAGKPEAYRHVRRQRCNYRR